MIDRLTIKYHGEVVGILSLTPDNRLCVFEYSRNWLSHGFSLSPLELPLKPGLFIAKPTPFYGNFGIFEDSLPDGYGRYLLHRALKREGIDDRNLTSIDRLSMVGSSGMGALCYEPATELSKEEELSDFELLQEKALEVLREQQDTDAGLLLYNSGNSGGCRPKAVFLIMKDTGWLSSAIHTIPKIWACRSFIITKLPYAVESMCLISSLQQEIFHHTTLRPD